MPSNKTMVTPTGEVYLTQDLETEYYSVGRVNQNTERIADAVTSLTNNKVSKPAENPNGALGQLLRSNGDGTTMWTSTGEPTDAQVGTAVSNWLANHPEATTTVQDGTISNAKLDSTLQGRLSTAESDIDTLQSQTAEIESELDIKASGWIKTASGNSVSIDTDVLQVKPLKSVVMAGTTIQDGTPSPTNYVPIQGLAGYDQKIVIDGSQNINKSEVGSTGKYRFIFGYSNSNDKVSSNASARNSESSYLPLLESSMASDRYYDGYTIGQQCIYLRLDSLSDQSDASVLAYLNEHPLTVWYRSTSFDATTDQYYAIGIEDANGVHHGVGTTEKIEPLFDGDSINFNTGVIIRVKNRVTAVGTEPWYKQEGDTYTGYRSNQSLFPDWKRRTTGIIKATLFEEGPLTGGDGKFYNGDVLIFLKPDKATADDYKTWLAGMNDAGTPLTVVYELTTPITENITLSGDMSNIFGSLTLFGTGALTVQYAANTSDALESLDTRVAELKNEKAGQLITSVAGSSVAIVPDKTQISPLKSVSLAGATAQDGTPSPASPVPVEGLAGYDQMVVIDGSVSPSASVGTVGDYYRITYALPGEKAGNADIQSVGSYLKYGPYDREYEHINVKNGANSIVLFVYIEASKIPGIAEASTVNTKKAAAQAYFVDHPLTVWYRSAAFDASADQYYAIGIEDADGTFLGVGTTEKIAPLYVGDTLDFAAGTVTRQTKRIVLTGEESFSLLYGSTDSYCFRKNGNPLVGTLDATRCTHFEFGSVTSATTVTDRVYVYTSSGLAESNLQIRPSLTLLSDKTAEAFKAWLADQYSSGHPVIVTYELLNAEMETTTLSANLRSIAAGLSLEGTMTLSGTGTLTVRYAADLKTYIDNAIANAIAALNA